MEAFCGQSGIDWVGTLGIVISVVTLIALFIVVVLDHRIGKRPEVTAVHIWDQPKLIIKEYLGAGLIREVAPFHVGEENSPFLLASDSLKNEWIERANGQIDHQYLRLENIGVLPAQHLVIAIHYGSGQETPASGSNQIFENTRLIYFKEMPSRRVFFVPCFGSVVENGKEIFWQNRYSILYQYRRIWTSFFFVTSLGDPTARRKNAYRCLFVRWFEKLHNYYLKWAMVKYVRGWDYLSTDISVATPLGKPQEQQDR